MKKALIAVAMSALLAIGGYSSAYGENTSQQIDSDPCTAGSWHTEDTYNVTYSSNLSSVYGGDVGTWFYQTSVGLQSSFVVATDRIVYFEMREDDTVLFPSSQHVRDYQASFELVNGLNMPYYYQCTYTNSGEIEDNGTVELYLKIKVSTNPADTSSSVPAGLVRYRFWTY